MASTNTVTTIGKLMIKKIQQIPTEEVVPENAKKPNRKYIKEEKEIALSNFEEFNKIVAELVHQESTQVKIRAILPSDDKRKKFRKLSDENDFNEILSLVTGINQPIIFKVKLVKDKKDKKDKKEKKEKREKKYKVKNVKARRELTPEDEKSFNESKVQIQLLKEEIKLKKQEIRNIKFEMKKRKNALKNRALLQESQPIEQKVTETTQPINAEVMIPQSVVHELVVTETIPIVETNEKQQTVLNDEKLKLKLQKKEEKKTFKLEKKMFKAQRKLDGIAFKKEKKERKLLLKQQDTASTQQQQ